MRCAILSDVHSNQPALQAVLADVRAVGAEQILCLGDLVGYGADPGPVVDTLAGLGGLAVAGNHDHGSTGAIDLEWFNPHARRAAEWTAERLTPAQVRYLATLPLVARHGDATLVHSSPRAPHEWTYLVSRDDGAEAFDWFPTRLCFVGHSHLPTFWTRSDGGRVAYRRGTGRLSLTGAVRHLVNVGSVGQPRDGDPSAAYALWDVEEDWVEVRRVAYDVQEARRRVYLAGLPRILGDRLLRGR